MDRDRRRLSRNGTHVNGERVNGRRRLRDGDRIASVRRRRCSGRRGTRRPSRRQRSRWAGPRSLTEVQRKVLVALCRPLKDSAYAAPATNREIAAEVHLRVDAVKAHLRVVFERSGSTTCRRTRSARGWRRSRWSMAWCASTSSDRFAP